MMSLEEFYSAIADAYSVAKGERSHYTKEEVNAMLVGDTDIQRIIDYLDALNGYELSMKEFDDLNGNGGNE